MLRIAEHVASPTKINKAAKARIELYSNRIAKAAHDLRRCWSTIRDVGLLYFTDTNTHQSLKESQNICNTILAFFDDKIKTAEEAIRIRLSSHIILLQHDKTFTIYGWTNCNHSQKMRSGD